MRFARYYRLFGLFIIGTIILLGVLLLFLPYFEYIPGNYRFIFSFLLIAYGLFRSVSLIQKNRIESDENEE